MKLFRIINRGIRDAFKSVFRNFSLSLASISCIAITLIIVAISIIASYNVNNFTAEIEKDLTIVAFVDNNASEEDIENIKKAINNIDNIDKNEIHSSEILYVENTLTYLTQDLKNGLNYVLLSGNLDNGYVLYIRIPINSIQESVKISKFLNKELNNNEIIIGPSISSLGKINNTYYFQIIIKYKDKNKMIDKLERILNHYNTNIKVKVDVNFNPVRI